MLAKEFLQRVEKLDIMINNKLAEQQQWMDMALSITANMSGERVLSSGGSKSKLEDAVVKCVDMEGDINRLIDELIDAKKDVIRVIEQVDNPTEYDVLHKRYIQKMSLGDIAERYGREYTWVTTTHGRGLQSVQKILDETKTDNILNERTV